VSASTLVLAAVLVAMLFSSAPPDDTVGRVLSALAGAGGIGAALLWAVRFPTTKQSIAYAFTCSASIALAALAQSDPVTAMSACSAFATISGYVALFHTAALMTANLVVVVASSAIPAVAFAATSGVVRAVCAFTVVLVVNMAVPFGIQIIVQTLGWPKL
jgi:hypothetical protein